MHRHGRTRLVPIFASLPADAAQALDALLVECSLTKSAVLFREGDASDGVYFLVSGKVKLSRSRLDATVERESLLRLLGPGSIFGELSSLDEGNRSSTATAVTDAEVLHLGQQDLNHLMHAHPEIAKTLLRQLAARVRWADRVLSRLSLNDMTGRVAATLIYLADTLGEATPRGTVVEHDLTQSELAAMVGGTRETVNRTLTDLASRGLIENGLRRVTILQPQRLRERII